MEVVTYHYVRNFDKKFKYFRFLEFKNFKRQLDYFASKKRFVSKEEFINLVEKRIKPPKNSILLTFDDGVIDHYKYVYKELKKRNIFGIFFISTLPLEKNIFLNVHKIHLLIGKTKENILLNQLKSLVTTKMIDKQKQKIFEKRAYSSQSDLKKTKFFKQFLNYFIINKYKTRILDELIRINKISLKVKNFYFSIQQAKEMENNGMMVGSHTFSHEVLSKLSYVKQKNEISRSIKFLTKKLENKKFLTFCFPYGEKFTYNNISLKILKNLGVKASFIVYSKKVNYKKLLNKSLEIPRFDCNEYPFGKIRKIK